MFKILVVEDSNIFRQTFIDSLKEIFPHFEFAEAANDIEALLKTRLFLPDLIFMDIKLPGASGLELTTQIKANNPDIKIVIMTNYDFPEYRDKAKESGADHFLPKGSLTEENISKLIEKVVSDHHSFNEKDVKPPK